MTASAVTGVRTLPLAFLNDSLRMTYDIAGHGFPVLLIHGHPFNRSMWLPQVQSLRWKYTTIVPDLHGYGQSERGSEIARTQETFACDLACLLDHLRIGRVCVVGLSMGGQIAMEFARAFPERTAALVLAAATPVAETLEGVATRNLTSDRIVTEGIVPVGSEMLCKLLGPVTLRAKPRLASTVFEMICSVDPLGAAAAVRGRALRRDYRQSLSRFPGPSMVVLGTDDVYTSLEDAKALRDTMIDCRLELFDDIGHMPNLEDEDHFNRCLHSFLDRLTELDHGRSSTLTIREAAG